MANNGWGGTLVFVELETQRNQPLRSAWWKHAPPGLGCGPRGQDLNPDQVAPSTWASQASFQLMIPTPHISLPGRPPLSSRAYGRLLTPPEDRSPWWDPQVSPPLTQEKPMQPMAPHSMSASRDGYEQPEGK